MFPGADTPLLAASDIAKQFGGVRALDGVSLSVRPGEVIGLVGENGAGKSTLMKVLAGIHAPDAGTLEWQGRPTRIPSTRAASELGIALIHQELELAENLDAGSNIYLGREPRRFGWIRHDALHEAAARELERVGASFSSRTRVGSLAIGERQIVEIAKALSQDARLLIMDEPTSSLSERETRRLLAIIDELRERGIAVIYISHRLSEIEAIADRVVVLRDGRTVGEFDRDRIDRAAMISMMVARAPAAAARQREPRNLTSAAPALVVQGLRTHANPEHALSFSVAPGEVVGIAGLVGAGRTELLETLFGLQPAVGGETGSEVVIDGVPRAIRSPRDAIDAGLALVPEDRKQQGLFLDLAIRINTGIASLPSLSRFGVPSSQAEHARCAEWIRALRIDTPHGELHVGSLSGGNQQKVVMARWLAMRPRVLLLDEPTRGVDVGGRQDMYELIQDLADQGTAVLFASSELEEILHLADRVLVLHEGRLTGDAPRQDLDEERIMAMATGTTAAVQR